MVERFVETRSLLLALAWTLATAGGCSIRYDADDLKGGGDGGIQVEPDADPDALHVQQVTPQLVFEGQGSALDPADQDRVRAVPVVLLGANFTADMTVSVAGEAFSGGDVPFTVSGDGHWAAFELRLPVDEDRGAGSDLPLSIAVSKGDELSEGGLVRRMLAELDRGVGGSIETVEESGVSLYSRVDLHGDVVAGGLRPVRMVGYAGIRIDGRVSAEGSGQTAGVGGCSGAAAVEDAGCGAGSGRRGEDALLDTEPGGGGGGAFGGADAQSGGGGAQGGEPGEPTAAPSLVPMPPASQSPAGGGGGGRALGLVGGHFGGGSGGILELTSPATIQLDGIVSVDGASPGPCDGNGGGGGGGGSGGAILLRAGAGVTSGTGATLQARGGVGSTVQCSTPGGDGGVGLIRVDQPDEMGFETEPAALPGPALVVDNQAIVTEGPDFPVMVRGKPGASYNVRVTGFDRESNAAVVAAQRVATPNGVGAAMLPLWAGHNEICVEVDADTSYTESQNCLTVAYIP